MPPPPPLAPCIGEGSSFTFDYATVAYSNLGGLGPDLWAPQGMRFVNTGTIFVNGVSTYVDTFVTNQSFYTADDVTQNTKNGLFLQVCTYKVHGPNPGAGCLALTKCLAFHTGERRVRDERAHAGRNLSVM